MEAIEPRGQLSVPADIEHPPEPTHKDIALPGTAQRLDLAALFEGDVSRLEHFAARFWQRVDGGTLDECRPWTGHVYQKTDYGRVRIRSPRGEREKSLMAHRVAWALVNRTVIPERVQVHHSCRMRACCNPAHLYLADDLGNVLELRVAE